MDGPTAEIWKRYPTIDRPIGPIESLGNAGGRSGARLWRFRAADGPRVLRRWPEDGPGRAAIERIHGWIGVAVDLGWLALPRPGVDGRTVQVDRAGGCWEIAPWLPGRAAVGDAPTPGQIAAGFGGLAALHGRWESSGPVTNGPSPGLVRRRAELIGWLGGRFDRLEGLILSAGSGDPTVEPAHRWLRLARPLAPLIFDELTAAAGSIVPIQPCLRDPRPDHFLFEGDRLTGVVDYGAMGPDTVAADLARLLAGWLPTDRPRRAAALAAYAALRPLSGVVAGLILAFERSAALLGPGGWATWHFEERRRFVPPDAAARAIGRGLAPLARIAAGGR